jgi:hypothetical protein
MNDHRYELQPSLAVHAVGALQQGEELAHSTSVRRSAARVTPVYSQLK